ncbi:MAG: 4-(cytidine 5'-diphospho)-2-C-methyl-D-erythritol kinase [Eubacteriales bacterium]|nr:4-(cytidine 5'-diphospho)-2-C-methyl-D-erythritol kinase [Eubacteriales bacterium]
MLCLKARAKINWTLDILGVREDGYHLMDMLMQSVALSDTLWMEKAEALTLEEVGRPAYRLREKDHLSSGSVPFDQRNLVYKAADILRSHVGLPLGARIQLEKRIPSGAGMGGGSADAAAALLGLNELWELHLPMETLSKLALRLGADVPFMLRGGLARVGGIGENLTPLFPAPKVWLLLLQPCDGLSTKEVFSAFDSIPPERLARPQTAVAQEALLKQRLPDLAPAMNNVLEGVSVQKRPALRVAKELLEGLGALRAMMTGSGSVVYGVFADEKSAVQAFEQLPPHEGFCAVTCTEDSGVNKKG